MEHELFISMVILGVTEQSKARSKIDAYISLDWRNFFSWKWSSSGRSSTSSTFVSNSSSSSNSGTFSSSSISTFFSYSSTTSILSGSGAKMTKCRDDTGVWLLYSYRSVSYCLTSYSIIPSRLFTANVFEWPERELCLSLGSTRICHFMIVSAWVFSSSCKITSACFYLIVFISSTRRWLLTNCLSMLLTFSSRDFWLAYSLSTKSY